MTLAILFWFYKNPAICRNRLRLLRRNNPGTAIFGLYGGPLEYAAAHQAALGDLLDDFYCFPDTQSPQWKWRNGDSLISDWFLRRGQHLVWDDVFIVQWDMVVAGPLYRILPPDTRGTVVLSGLRPMTEVESIWWWTKPGSPEGRVFETFRAVMTDRLHYAGPLFACQFIVACLPRTFLQRYAENAPDIPGFLEYKIPSLAKAWGFNCYDGPVWQHCWPHELKRLSPISPLGRADGLGLPFYVLALHRLWPRGNKIFHPYLEPYPESWPAWLREMTKSLFTEIVKPLAQRLRTKILRRDR